ncbi:MAG: hypothetical protein QM811_31875 [Pirellulales bacterium]
MKRYHYAFKRLHGIFLKRLTAEPIYELKTAFSHHAYLCAEHTAALRKRVTEMREPPLGLDDVPHAALELVFDEIQAAPTTAELILGIYDRAIPALRSALERHLTDTNRLVDAPSVRICRFALLELADIAAFGAAAIRSLVDDTQRASAIPWLAMLDAAIAACGGLDGAAPEAGTLPNRSIPKLRTRSISRRVGTSGSTTRITPA